MPTIDGIARTINGPNEAKHIGEAKLIELQNVGWGQLKSQEQVKLLRAATYVQKLFETDPDGFVITNGDDTQARTNTFEGPGWTKDLNKALWLARRDDAERYCADDEDAWHIRRVSEVRRMWAAPPRSEGVPDRSTGAPHAGAYVERIASPTGAVPPPVPLTLPVDQRSENDLLRLFRQFVSLNATQWVIGAGDHHHPMWEDLAQVIDGEEATFGPDYAFIQPTNRKPHALLVEEYADQQNEREATDRGG